MSSTSAKETGPQQQQQVPILNNQQQQQQPPPLTQPLANNRSVLILRNIDLNTLESEIKNIFNSEKCPSRPVHCELALEDKWYVTFKNDEDARLALAHIRKNMLQWNGKHIMAGYKTKPANPSTTDQPPPHVVPNMVMQPQTVVSVTVGASQSSQTESSSQQIPQAIGQFEQNIIVPPTVEGVTETSSEQGGVVGLGPNGICGAPVVVPDSTGPPVIVNGDQKQYIGPSTILNPNVPLATVVAETSQSTPTTIEATTNVQSQQPPPDTSGQVPFGHHQASHQMIHSHHIDGANNMIPIVGQQQPPPQHNHLHQQQHAPPPQHHHPQHIQSHHPHHHHHHPHHHHQHHQQQANLQPQHQEQMPGASSHQYGYSAVAYYGQTHGPILAPWHHYSDGPQYDLSQVFIYNGLAPYPTTATTNYTKANSSSKMNPSPGTVSSVALLGGEATYQQQHHHQSSLHHPSHQNHHHHQHQHQHHSQHKHHASPNHYGSQQPLLHHHHQQQQQQHHHHHQQQQHPHQIDSNNNGAINHQKMMFNTSNGNHGTKSSTHHPRNSYKNNRHK